MSVVLKCLLGLFAVLCFVQFVEMTRIRRDEPATGAGENVANGGLDLNEMLNSLVSKLKTTINLDEDTVKKVMDFTQNAIEQGTKALKEGAAKASETVQNIAANAGNGGGNGNGNGH